MSFRGLVQARCQGVSIGLASSGEAAPAAGIEPIPAVSCGVDVDGDENHLVGTILLADLVYAAAALFQGDVVAFWNYELSVKAQVGEAFPDQESEVAVVGVFAEVIIGASLAGCVKAMAIVEKNLHNCRLGSDGKMEIICGNNYFQVMPSASHQKRRMRSNHQTQLPGVAIGGYHRFQRKNS